MTRVFRDANGMVVSDYAKRDSYYWRHHGRYKRFVESRTPRLVCQECRGYGGETEVIDPEIGGPWVECPWCEGTGFVTPHIRSYWLRAQRWAKEEAKG